MKNILCTFGFHRWNYYKKTIKLETPNIINRDKINVPLRECSRCNELQHHLGPMFNGNPTNWKPGEKFRNSESL